ncbi:TPA: TIGR04197 family type VII secretion effector, partial [Streptococcus equi subsp. zooepidemicus]|nr:TIGR04197 family type VII secretion effector [Streptococcus equi subsp. zooepidemicus]
QQSVAFSVTKGIAGMEKGRQVSNQLLQAVSDFSQAVLIHANKFPQLAAKLEKRDLEEATRWGNQS